MKRENFENGDEELKINEAVKSTSKRKVHHFESEWDNVDFESVPITERVKPDVRLRLITHKSKEEILANGTAEEIGYLIGINNCVSFCEEEWDNEITDIENITLQRRLSDKERDEADRINALIFALTYINYDFEEALSAYQWKAYALARYVAQKEMCEIVIAGMNELIKHGTIGNYTSVIGKTFSQHLKGDVHIKINNSRQGYFLEFGDRDYSLKNMLEERCKYLEIALKKYKIILIAIQRYLKKNKLPMAVLLPRMIISFNDWEKGDFYRSLLLDPKFFKKNINERMANGVNVTEQEYNEAIFPDLNEIEVDEEAVKYYFENLQKASRYVYQKGYINL